MILRCCEGDQETTAKLGAPCGNSMKKWESGKDFLVDVKKFKLLKMIGVDGTLNSTAFEAKDTF
jgi:hypothetical protein